MKAYECVLLTLITKHYVSLPALLTLPYSSQSLYRAVSQAKANKHIKQTTMAYKSNGHSYIIKYYTITKSGFNYFLKTKPQEVVWCDYLPQEVTRLRVAAVAPSAKNIERYLRRTTAALFAESLSCPTSILFLSQRNGDDDEAETCEAADSDPAFADVFFFDEGHEAPQNGCNGDYGDLLSEIIKNAISRCADESDNGPSSNETNAVSEFYYRDINEIRQQLGAKVKSDNGQYDTLGCRITGILESSNESLALYVGSSSGMPWRKWLADKEQSVHAAYANRISPFGPLLLGDNQAAVIVANVKVFDSIYNDSLGRRKREKEILGNGYSNFYVIPLDASGKSCLMDLMNYGAEEYEQLLISEAVNSSCFVRNNEVSASLFPLASVDDKKLVMLGTLIDIIKLQRLQSMLKAFPELRFSILCFEWEVPYYQKVIPDASFTFAFS